MAGNDTAALVVALSAQLTQFEKDMASAGDIADKHVHNIETRFHSANLQVPGLDAFISKIEKLATGAGIALLVSQMHELNAEVAKLGESAERVGLSTDELQKFRFAIVATGGSLDVADGFLDTFSRKIAEAATGTGALYNFLRVNNVALKDANGQLLPLNTLLGKYADLVKNTKSAQDQINEAFLVGGRAAGPQLVNALKLGSDGLKNLGDEAARSGVVIDKELIERARKINTEYEKLKLQFTTTAQEVAVSTWDLLARSISNVSSSLSEFIAQFELVKNLKDRIATGGGQSGDIGGFDVPGVGFIPGASPGKVIAPPTQPNRSDISSPLAAGAHDDRQQAAPAAGNNTTVQFNAQADAFDKLIKAEDKRIALLGVEQAAIGKTAGEAAALRTQVELENEAREKNIPLTTARVAAIQAEASKAGLAAQALDDYKRQWAGLNSAVQFAGDQAIDILDGLRNKTLTAADAMKQLQNSIIHALEQAVLLGSGPLAGVLGLASKTTGGTGGLLGSLLGSFNFGGAKAGGGDVSSGKMYLVGENGPELFSPGSSGSIIPNGISPASSGGGLAVQVNNYASGDTDTQQRTQSGPDGQMLIIDVVKKSTARGDFDSVNRARFGQRPNKVR